MSKLTELVGRRIPINVDKMTRALHEALHTVRRDNVDTRSFVILGQTGFDRFLGDRRGDVQACLTRLLANDDIQGAKQFLHEAVLAIAEDDGRQADEVLDDGAPKVRVYGTT